MKHILRVVAHWGLLIHIYVSMSGFMLVLLFAITGLTLNHEDFGLSRPQTATSTIMLPAGILENPNQQAIGGQLSKSLGIQSPVTDYKEDPDQIQVTFAAPGHRTLVTINRVEHMANVETETRGLLGRLDDLHKGFDSGPSWSWLIDLTAVFLTISSITGMVTLLSLRARRRSGFIVGGLSAAVILAIYWIWVPR